MAFDAGFLSAVLFECQNVLKNGHLTLSVLSEDTPNTLIQRFGTKTSKDTDKWEEGTYELLSDLPILKNSIVAMELKVQTIQETAGHYVFLCNVVQIAALKEGKPLLYADYQARSKSTDKKWVCTICGYVYDPAEGDWEHNIDPGTPFSELPSDWVCPICGLGKEDFYRH